MIAAIGILCHFWRPFSSASPVLGLGIAQIAQIGRIGRNCGGGGVEVESSPSSRGGGDGSV
ncbi:hypothetical protein M758_UG139900 [Ceratodon purpureus]|nr:hypothetical protein M758_UG139900 [Ceratodon purpureus]